MSQQTIRQRGKCNSKSFRALLLAQFFGALNDNLFKLFVTLLVVRHVMQSNSGITHLVLINICFITPYILFSTIAGGLADKLSKTKILRAAKVFELFVMSAAAYFLARESTYALLIVLFCMGTQSTLFSPSKYGILPELLDEVSLSKGNGYLEFVTFIGIIFGTALAGVVLSMYEFSSGVPGTLLLVMSVIGVFASMAISLTPAVSPATEIKTNPFRMWTAAVHLRKNHSLFLSILAISYFWSIGALYQLNLVLFGSIEAGLGDLAVSLQLASLGIGIGVGSIFAGKVSEGKVELGLVPLGALGLAFWSIVLSFIPAFPILTGFVLVGVGFSAGFYIVPLNAFLQENSPSATRGNTLAACNFISFSGMLFFSLLLLLGIDYLGMKPSGIFLISGLSAIGIAIYICSVLPEVLLRCINWLLMHLVYRIKVQGEENVPEEGGGLLVCNHVSMVDACLLLASLARPVRFLMFRPYYESKLVHPFAKALGTIPIEAGGKNSADALKGASKAVSDGELVGIFAEGAITRTGHMLRFRSGLERIMNDAADAPIIPVYLDQVWGSVFSFRNGRFFWKLPRKIPYPVSINFGKPLPADASASSVRNAVQELSAEAFSSRANTQYSLPAAFARAAKNNGLRTAIVGEPDYSYYLLLAESLALSKLLPARLGESTAVFVQGIHSTQTALLQLAALFAGKTVIPIDEVVDDASIALVRDELGVSHCLTAEPDTGSRDALQDLEQLSYAQLRSEVSALSLSIQYAASVLLPGFLFDRLCAPAANAKEDTALIVFSRGRTEAQKAVRLSHHNIVSNCSAFQELFSFYNNDVISGSLPLSHAMGSAALLWLPLLSGCQVACREVKNSKLARQRYLFLTTRQLEERLRTAGEEKDAQIASAEFVIVGGDEMSPELRDSFHANYEATLLEGYGSAELAPLALINVPDYEDESKHQHGQKQGMAGHPLPGVSIKVMADNETPCAPGEEGELWVKGPNVMQGYVGQSSEEVLIDGWLKTGDRAIIDSDGFVAFRGRSV